MLKRIFPERIDNNYRGHVLAIWIFAALVFMKVAISLLHVFNADGGAQSISAIPLDTYMAGAATNVIALFARMGLEQFLLGLVFIVVLVRYRAMIPLMFVMIVIGLIGHEAVVYMKPLVRTGEFGASTPAMVFRFLSISGLVLSLIGKGYSREPESASDS